MFPRLTRGSGLNFSAMVGYAMRTGTMTPETTKLEDERQARMWARIGAIALGLLALAIIAVAFSSALRGQGPATTSSAPNDPNSAAAAPRDWPTPDARPLEIDRGTAGLWQALLKLHTRASLLMLVAHP